MILTVVTSVLFLTTGQALAQTSFKTKHKTLTMLPKTHDWKVSTNLVNRVFPGTKQWLLDCSSTEGGSGLFVWHDTHGGPGIPLTYSNVNTDAPGGWMQFFKSTFNNYRWSALRAMKHRGFIVDGSLYNFYEPLGQALVAGYMRSTGLDGGQWTGWKC